MAFDFPNAPALGQQYPAAPVAGQPTYVWDGEKWTLQGSMSGIIPTGTVMVFYQAAAPIGWTKVVTQNDKALRVVNGASGGGAGGSNPFSTVMAQTVVGGHTLTRAEIPTGITVNFTGNVTVYPSGTSNNIVPFSYDAQMSYTLGILQSATSGVPPGYPVPFSVGTRADQWSGTATFLGSNNITSTSNNTSGGSHNHPITMDIQYCDVILASKN
jgi:hypothetical protein